MSDHATPATTTTDPSTPDTNASGNAPAAPTAPSAPSAPVNPKQARLERATTWIASRTQAAPPVGGTPAPASDEAPAAQTETPPAAESVSETKTEPADDKDLRFAKAQQAAIRQKREAFEAKQRAEAEAAERAKLAESLKSVESKLAGKSVDDLQDAIAALSGKDAKALRAFMRKAGVSMEELAQVVVDEPDATPEDPTQVKLRTLEQQIADMAKAKKEAEEAAERERIQRANEEVHRQNIANMSELLKQEAEKYPLLSGFERAPAEIVRRFNAYVEQHDKEPDIDDIIDGFHRDVDADMQKILASDAAFKALITRPENKERALKFLEVKPSANVPASNQGDSGQRKGAPAAIPPQAAASAGDRKARPQTQEEKIAAALAFVKTKAAR